MPRFKADSNSALRCPAWAGSPNFEAIQLCAGDGTCWLALPSAKLKSKPVGPTTWVMKSPLPLKTAGTFTGCPSDSRAAKSITW